MTNGFLCVNKPSSISSNKVLGILKYNLRKIGFNDKIGHMGTLDPLATGVLPVCLGRATRLFDYSLDKIKVYEATFLFGASSDTLDVDGDVILDPNFTMPSEYDIRAALNTQIGSIEQIPPMYSAKSINGVRAYTLARKGVDVELQPKRVVIHDIRLLETHDNEIRVEITCGGGTYVRSIGRDVAKHLGTTAVMTSLIRKQSGVFSLDNSITLREIEENPSVVEDRIIPISAFLSDYPAIKVTEEQKKKLLNGIRLASVCEQNVLTALYCEDELLGIATTDEEGKTFVKTWLL